MFSKACQYGLRALIYLARQSMDGRRVRVEEISKETNNPKAFTAKILQQLAKNKIIKSVKGPYGGFEIEEDMLDKLKLVDIVFAIDGPDVYNECGLGLKTCDPANPCPIHDEYTLIKERLNGMLQNMSFRELANNYQNGDILK